MAGTATLLQRVVAGQGRVLGEVHRTRAALPEFADHPVAGHMRAGRQQEAANETGARLALLAAHGNPLRLGCNRFSTVERNPGSPPIDPVPT